MKSIVASGCFSIVFLLAVAAPVRADLKYEQVYRSNGKEQSRQTYSMAGNRMRMDMGSDMSVIFNCETQESVMLNHKDGSCIRMGAGQMETMGLSMPGEPASNRPPRRGGVVRERLEVVDTGERKQIFGFTARHILVTASHDAGPDTCHPGKSEFRRDLWLIDLAVPFRCESFKGSAFLKPGHQAKAECEDEIRSTTVGDPRLQAGFVIKEISTTIDEQGGRNTSEMEVVSLSAAAIPASAFAAPADCTDMSSIAGALGQARGSAAQASRVRPPVAEEQSARRTGVLLVGVVSFKDTTGKSLDLTTLRQSLISDLNEPVTVEAIPLAATEPPDVLKEAQEKHCAYVVYTTLIESKVSGASKIGGILGRATGTTSGEVRVSVKLEYQLVKVETSAQISRRPINDTTSADVGEATAAERLVLTRATTQTLGKEARAVLSDISSDARRP